MNRCIHIVAILCVFSCGLYAQKSVDPSYTGKNPRRTFFIYRNGGEFKLGDSLGVYENSPAGDTIVYLSDYTFAFRNKGLFNVYDYSFDTLMKGQQFFGKYEHFCLFRDDKGFRMFYPPGYRYSDYYDSIYVSPEFVWLLHKGKQGGFFRKSAVGIKVDPLYDAVGPYYGSILLIKNNKLGLEGEISIPVKYDHIYKFRPDMYACETGRGTEYYSLRTNELLSNQPSDSVSMFQYYYKIIRENKEILYSIVPDESVCQVSNLHVYPLQTNGTSNYEVVTNDSACAIFKGNVAVTRFDYDNVLEETSGIQAPFFRVEKDHQIGMIDDKGTYLLKPMYNNIIEGKGDYYVIQHGSSRGISMLNDTVILEAKYRSIFFYDNTYAIISDKLQAFGVYNYKTKKQITDIKYKTIKIGNGVIRVSNDGVYDVYYHEKLMATDMRDVQVNKANIKCYKNGKVFLFYGNDDGSWEEYNYEIPSYTIKEEIDEDLMYSQKYEGLVDQFDYISGKWGYYNYANNKWDKAPIAPSSSTWNSTLIVDFPNSQNFEWQGIDFIQKKDISVLSEAHVANRKYKWINIKPYSYSISRKNYIYSINPIVFSVPGKGRCLQHFNSTEVNYVYSIADGKNILEEKGDLQLGTKGEVSLSDFYCNIAESGCLHPASINDYKIIIGPEKRVSFKNSVSHVLNIQRSEEQNISPSQTFQWIDKSSIQNIIYRTGHNYGLSEFKGGGLLKPMISSITQSDGFLSSEYKLGFVAEIYKVFDPETKTFSREIRDLLATNDTLLNTGIAEGHNFVLNEKLDTLYAGAGQVMLKQGTDYTVKTGAGVGFYENGKLLFTSNCQQIERVNDNHFICALTGTYQLVNSRGELISVSSQPLKTIPLGKDYIINTGASLQVFDENDKLKYDEPRAPYLIGKKNTLLIKNKETSVLLKQHEKITLSGHYQSSTDSYIITTTGKTKTVYDYTGKILYKKLKKAKALVDSLIVIQQGKKYYLVDITTNEVIPVKSMNISYENKRLEFEEDAGLSDMNFYEKDTTYEIEQKNSLYGITRGTTVVLKPSYYTIKPLGKSFLIQDRLQYKVYRVPDHEIATEMYDEIIPYREYFLLIKNGQFTYINRFGKSIPLQNKKDIP